MKERIDPTPFEPERFIQDLRGTAEALGAGFSEPATRQALAVFDEEFRSCVVQLKTEARPGGGLYYRFFYNGSGDLTRRAQEAGMIPRERSPIVTLQDEVLARFGRATRAGIDFDTATGLAKVWTFTGGPVPLAEVLRVRALPDAFRAHADFFARHGLDEVYLVASDHQKKTMNVYFGWSPEDRTVAWMQRLAAQTGDGPLDEELCQDVLGSQTVSGGLAVTFSWDRPELRRWSFYALEVPYAVAAPGVRLPRLPPRLEKFRAAPTLNECPQYIVGWSFGRVGPYMKMEKSYACDATHFITVQMGGDLSRPSPPPPRQNDFAQRPREFLGEQP
jgi:4-hydroxyphenylpyruvate 3-dimethylallyltransferase